MSSRPKVRKLATVIVPILVLGISVVVAAYFIKSRPEAKPREAATALQTVQAIEAAYATVTPQINNFGEVIASREAEFRAMVSGRLVFVADEFKDGAVITAGTKIAQVDPFEFELAVDQAEANLKEAEARLSELKSDASAEKKLLTLSLKQIELRQRDRDRSANLIKKGQTSKKALDDANIALNSALELKEQRQQTVSRSVAKISQQQAIIQRLTAALSQAKRNLQDTTIVAPFSGYLTDTGVALGKRVAVGESIGRLISSEKLQVRFQLNNDDYARLISQGKSDTLFSREVAIEWHLGDDVLNYRARIERRAAEIDPASGGVTVYATILAGDVNSGGDIGLPLSVLRPGAFVEISLADISYSNVISLPEDAVVDGDTVFTIKDDVLQSKKITVVRRDDGQVLVRGDIEEGVPVVTVPFSGIGPGIAVQVLAE